MSDICCYECSSGDERVTRALLAIERASTPQQYEAAKEIAAECEPIDQLAMVDMFIAAATRTGVR